MREVIHRLIATPACWDGAMRVNRVVPNLSVDDVTKATEEHAAVLGLKPVMDHGWIVTLADAYGHQLSVMTRDASAPVNPDISVFVDDVHEALERARQAELEIVHPLTQESWGVTRFFYRATDGRVVNVGMHTETT